MRTQLLLHRLFAVVIAAAAISYVGLSKSFAVEIEKVVSPGGIEAWLVEDTTVPIVAINFSFDAGSAQDPDGKEGLTRLLAASLDEGAGDLPSEAFQARMEELVISIGFSTGKDRFYGSLRTLSNTLDEATELLALALHSPRFDDTPVNRMKIQLTAQAKRSETDPDAIAGRALVKAMFGDHLYARPTGGTPETLDGLSTEDLREHHKNLLSKSGLKVGVVGAIDAETLKSLLDDVFGSLPETPTVREVPEVSPVSGKQIFEQLDVPQTSVLIGLPGLKRNDEDYQAAYVMNHILGGGSFTSWMYQEVREKRGLSYSAGTSLSPYEKTGILIGSAATKAERSDETVAVILEQLERMATEGPSETELQAAKRYLTGSYPLRFDSSGKIARQLVALQNAELGMDYFDRRNDEIEAVTLEDVKRVAERLLKDREPTIVLVGPHNN